MKSKTRKIATWVSQGILSLIMLFFGIMKVITPYEESIKHANGGWITDFSPTQITIIGILEILGVIGMNLPFLLRKFKKLVPVAATGLSLTMMGGVITHILRGKSFIIPTIILAIALFVVFGRKELLRESPELA